MGVGALFAVIIEKEAFGTYFLGILYGVGLFLSGIIFSIRFRMWQPAVLMCWTGLALWHYFLAARPGVIVKMLKMVGYYRADIATVDWLDQHFSLAWALLHIGTILILGPLFMPVVQRSHKLEQSARKIFKLAAEMVPDTGNSYTDRPYFAGQEKYQYDELIGFSRYLSGKDIVRYRVTQQGVELGFSMGRSPMADKTFQRISHISFDNGGKIVVQISEKDYKMYKQHLTFDQLCASLSNLFWQFFEYYRNGNEGRILTELKSI
jgi:hypothetical protein